jgi:hypothetical protein
MLDHNQLGASRFTVRLQPSSSRHFARVAASIWMGMRLARDHRQISGRLHCLVPADPLDLELEVRRQELEPGEERTRSSVIGQADVVVLDRPR